MNIYPWSVIFSDAAFIAKMFAFAAIIFCVLFTLWVYRNQSGRNLTKEKNEIAKTIAKIPKRRNSSSQLPVTASALLNKPDSISVVTYPESRNETTPLINKKKPRNIIAKIVAGEK